MSFRPDTTKRLIQDMPPPGGFPMIDFAKKSAARRGPTGMQLWGVTTLAIMWGFHRVHVMNEERNEARIAAREVKYMIAPILQAEADRRYVERQQGIIDYEADIMKNVDGWEAGKSMFMTKRWVPNAAGQLDRNTKK